MQNPFAITKTGFVGVPVFWSGTVWTTPPVYAPDGVTVVTAGTPRDISGWRFRLVVKSSYRDPDSAAVFLSNWTIVVGTSGAWAAEMPATTTVSIKGGSTLVWDLKVIILGATEPTEFAAGTVAMQNTAGSSLFV
jgi:hypothetical protein